MQRRNRESADGRLSAASHAPASAPSPAEGFDAAAGLRELGELVRLTSPPATRAEICEQGLGVMARMLGARSALLLLSDGPGGAADVAAVEGRALEVDLAGTGRSVLAAGEPLAEISSAGSVQRVVFLLPGDTSPLGAVVFDRPRAWGPAAREFARSASRVIAGAMRATRAIVESRQQREMLAQRNLELDILRELALRLQEFHDDAPILQAALDLLLEKLGLTSGWIFWGEERRGQLELAAARGVSPDFGELARRDGLGDCLCVDVFETGRLRFARNTTDCPRLPGLVCGREPLTHACVPLKFERGVLGVMNICNRPGQLFTARELQFLEAAGKQVCLAVDKSRTARAERKRNSEAQALASFARAIGGRLDLGTIVAVTARSGRDLIGVTRSAVFLADAGQEGPFRFVHGAGTPFPGIESSTEGGLETLGLEAALPVLRDGLTFAIEDAKTDSRIDREAATRNGVGSGLLVPLRVHGQMRGVLAAVRERPGSWAIEQVELAEALGRQAALALETARLYGEAQKNLKALQQAQEAMMRNERLAAVGTLAASLAHEVRNPLNSINLQLVLLQRRLARLPEAERIEMSGFLETARREINRLDGLVQESLAFSNVDRLVLLPGSPEEAVREILALMAPMARERGVEVREDLGSSPAPIPFDREKLKQVLINLVRNAIEAMPKGGTLRVGSRHENGTFLIRVADSGVGIEPGVDVFDLFVTTKEDGTGLGLPIAKRIVEAHGGSLSFESAPGKGTTFTVALKVP